MARTFFIFLLALGGVYLSGCDAKHESVPTKPAVQSKAVSSLPTLSKEEVLRRFWERASIEEVRAFERRSSALETAEQDRAMEMVLFKLTADEFLQVGITATGGPDKWGWAVAGSPDGGESFEAVGRALNGMPGVMASCDLGRCGWYLPRDYFFRGRRALLALTNLAALDIRVAEPRFNLP